MVYMTEKFDDVIKIPDGLTARVPRERRTSFSCAGKKRKSLRPPVRCMDGGFPQNRETKEALNDEKTDLRACGGAAAPCATASAAPLPEGMTYLAACRVEGETTEGVTFAVTEAAYDGASLTLEVLLTPNDEDTALMDNQVELPPEDSWFLREKEKAAALGDRVLGVACEHRRPHGRKGQQPRHGVQLNDRARGPAP